MLIPELVQAITTASGVTLRPAGWLARRKLRKLGAPADVVGFFARYEPSRFAEIGDVRLLPIADVLVENSDAEPGASIHPHGLLTFATTKFGDAYCLDLTDPSTPPSAVVLMSHEVGFLDMSREEILAHRKTVATSFHDFLERFVGGTLDIEPFYEAGGEG
jgi:SMI1/KNR4 family protein SUKH-1